MRRSIATVCLSGMLREKLEAIAAARFDGVEIFENDLLQFSGKPREVRRIAADLGLAIDMFQPFRDFDAATPAQLARSLERAERKFDLMAELGGTSACALALSAADPLAALARAEALGCMRLSGQVGPGELDIPAVSAPDGSLLYFCGPTQGGRHAFEADFVVDTDSLRDMPAAGAARIDHIVQAAPGGQVEPWVLFQRAVLGLLPQRNTVLHDPYGVIRSREIESADGCVRYSLMVSERDNTVVSRSVSRYGGAGVQQVAIAVENLIDVVAQLRRRGAPMLPVPDNYYDDLAARYDLEPELLEGLRASGVLYERGPQGEFLHAYAAPFEDRFEFEFVERRGGYELYGSTNAPVRLAALAQWRAVGVQ